MYKTILCNVRGGITVKNNTFVTSEAGSLYFRAFRGGVTVKNNTFVTIFWGHVIDFTDFEVADTPQSRGGMTSRSWTLYVIL